MNFFEEIASIMNSDSARRIARKTGLSKDRVRRMAQGCPFFFDNRIIAALKELGYEIIIITIKKK